MIKILIDPGHGGNDSGAVGNGLQEKTLTLVIAKKVKDYLDTLYTGHITKLSRETDKFLSLKQRTDMANNWGADYLLSIHINAGGGTGYEDYIHSSLSKKSHTAKLRDTIHNGVIKHAPNWRNRGSKKANFHVLRESRMPAMLTENGFIDNKTDANRLKDSNTLDNIAKGHALGIAVAFNLKIKKTTPKPPTSGLYRVQVGAYLDKQNAESMAYKLNKKGYETYIVHE